MSMEFSIRLEMPIIRSQTPPIWEECGGLKTQVQPSSPKYFQTLGSSGSVRTICNSLQAPLKLVPQSERICLAGPLRAKNRRKALMKLEVSIASINYVHGTCAHARKKYSPPFAVSLTSAGSSCGNNPRTEHIKSHVGEGWLCAKAI